MFRLHFRHHTTWPTCKKRQHLDTVVNIRSADWLSKPNPIVTKLVSLTTRVTLTFASCCRTLRNFHQLSTALAITTNCQQLWQLSPAVESFYQLLVGSFGSRYKLSPAVYSFDRVSKLLSDVYRFNFYWLSTNFSYRMLPWLVSQTKLLRYCWKRQVYDQTWDDIFGQGGETIFPHLCSFLICSWWLEYEQARGGEEEEEGGGRS